MIEMHISEIGFCSGHSASGVFVDEFARTTVPGLYAAGDMASVPHNYMLGAFTNGSVAGEDAVEFAERHRLRRVRRGRRRARAGARAGADQARGRHSAEPDRVQDAPPRQRLSAAAEGHAQVSSSAQERFAEVREDMENAHDGAQCARADARAGGAARSSTAPTWRRTPRSTAPRAAGASITCAPTIPEKDDDELVLPHAAAQAGRPA